MVAGFASIPLLLKAKFEGQNLTTQKGALGGNASMRGAYMNWGSKDVGADPDWDAQTRTYKGKGGGTRFNPSEKDIEEGRRALEAKLRERGLLKEAQATTTTTAGARAEEGKR